MIVRTPEELSEFRDVWVVAENDGAHVAGVTHELLGAARALADARGVRVCAALLGHGVTQSAQELFAWGADVVYFADSPLLSGFQDELEAEILARLIQEKKPEIVLGAATPRGRALLPRAAVLTESGLTADCTELAIDPTDGALLQTRPAFGGNIMATIRCPSHRPQMATVRPRVMKALAPDASRRGEVIPVPVPASARAAKEILSVLHEGADGAGLGDAQVIVAGGRAMKGEKGFALLRELASRLGAAVGASRAAVDAGWIPYAHQIGQTGQTVQTKVYVACGISGQIQHLVGMQSCETIIALDKNPDTPLMRMADVAVVGDLFETIPEIIRLLDSAKKERQP